MKETATQQSTYALGHSEQELERLSRQAQAFGALYASTVTTSRDQHRHARFCDVGCGSGDVAFLAADLVGPTGEVIGADRAAAAAQRATARAQARDLRNVKFLEGDPTEMQFDRPFDAVIGRLVLMYYPDPVDAVRRLGGHVREGGRIIFQEFDIANCRSLPPAPTFERHISRIKQTLSATGARTQLGLELYSVLVAAGLPGPTMRMDAVIGGGPDCPVYELVVQKYLGSLLPVMEKLKIATATEVGVASLAQTVTG